MSIVFITIPGTAKQDFAHQLQEQTDSLQAIILQQKPRRSIIARTRRTLKHQGIFGFFSSLWFNLRLRLSGGARERLALFRLRSDSAEQDTKDWPIEPITTPSVNSEEVFQVLSEIKPSLLVVWGSGMIDQRILDTADRAINLHMGLAPYYRGAIANQQAFLQNDMEHIGATIHDISNRADAGTILAQVFANPGLPVREMFRSMNDQAETAYLEIVQRLHAGEEINGQAQDLSLGTNYLLRDWTPKIRFSLSKKLQERL